MFAIAVKWLVVLALVAAVVFGAFNPVIRKPTISLLHKYRWQISLTGIAFIGILFISLQGT